MELLIGAFLGTIATRIFMAIMERRDKSYQFDCIHCRNGGKLFVLKANDKNVVGMMADDHKKTFHPYAA